MQDYSLRRPGPLLLPAVLRSHFRPACSEGIFTVPLLAPVLHHHRFAAAFQDTATLFVVAFLLCYYEGTAPLLPSHPGSLAIPMISHYSPLFFRLSSIFGGIWKFFSACSSFRLLSTIRAASGADGAGLDVEFPIPKRK